MIRAATFTLLVAALTLALPSALTASPVIYIDDGANRLGTVDIGTGAVNVIGPMGQDTMTDIAFAPNGTLYGISFGSLYTINTTTGAAALIGAHGIGGANALVFGTDGTLYAAGSGNPNLYTVNPTTGAGAVVGALGVVGGSAGDLAFNGGNLYMSSATDALIRINTTTGAGAVVGPFGFSSVFGLATADNGLLYGISGTQIFTVNTATGAGTFVRDYSGGGLGRANGSSFIGEAAPTPEPATLAVFAGLVGVSGIALRRRKPATA